MADKDDKVWVYGLEDSRQDLDPVVGPEVTEEWERTEPGGEPGRRLDRKLLLSVLAGVIIGVSLWAAFFRPPVGPAEVRYEVVAGDTLWRIADSHGVTVEQLKEWNGLHGDLIEVGQVLVIHPPRPEAGTDRRAGRHGGRRGDRRRSGGGVDASSSSAPEPVGLVMPAPRPCVQLDEHGLGDADMVASKGLSYEQTRAALDSFLPTLNRCLEPGAIATGTATFEITVGCDGRVTEVQLVDHAGLDSDLLHCVQQTLQYVPFPAHDMPDGFTFAYPMHFGP